MKANITFIESFTGLILSGFVNGFSHRKIKFFLLVWSLSLLVVPARSQCNTNLIEAAMAQSGNNAIFMREFRARLPKGSARNPIPSGKYNVYLKENTGYRFNVANDMSSGGEAILQLFDNGQLVGSTVENGNDKKEAFDYHVSRTGSFQVIISFKEGKPGCAVGIMSMIGGATNETDSLRNEKNNELDILYLNVENPISIITDKDATDTIHFEIDNGVIWGKVGDYYIKPEMEGLATLKVVIKNKKGHIKEEARSDFLVRRLPFPSSSINGLRGGIISRSSLQLASSLNIDDPLDFEKLGFQIIDFVVRVGDKGERRFLNLGKSFNVGLKSLMADLPDETRLVVEFIRVKKPDGQTITLEPLAFIIR